MEHQILLRDPEVTKPPFQLSPEWRYYNDGKSWLCKMLSKKKNLFWLSIWEGCFRGGPIQKKP